MSASYDVWNKSQPPPYTSDSNDYTSKDNLATQSTATDDSEDTDRGQWGHKAEFLLSCIGLSVGLGNVWRFPVLAYENGGAAFLIPYIILQLVIGKPMYFMELAMGQYSGQGPTGVWRLNPSAKGIGVAMVTISVIVAIYYNVIMAYCLYYFFATMQESLPWMSCKEEWLEKGCVVRNDEYNDGLATCTWDRNFTSNLCICTKNATIDYNLTDTCVLNITMGNDERFTWGNTTLGYDNCTKLCLTSQPAASIYFYDDVIQRAVNMAPENIGGPIWYLALCLLLSWIVVVACLIKGVKSSGKVVYFTATFPYVILLVLLVRGALLPGAVKGVEYFLIPDWEKLLDLKVWQAAASQMFFSLSVSFGGIIMYGSYNKFSNKVYGDALLISIMDILTSIIAGFVIFTTLGSMSEELGVPIEDVAKKGYGLAFVAYPEALARLPIPHLWSLLFFFMLFTLGLDSEFALLETGITCFLDEWPRFRPRKWLVCLIAGIVCFFLALPCVTPGGDWVITLLDSYGASFSVLFVALSELIAVMWVYRVDNFFRDIRYMLGGNPHPWPYWWLCWTVAAPILIFLLLIYVFVGYTPPSYEDDTPYEIWAQVVGWIIFAIVMLPIPGWFIITIVRQPDHNLFSKLKSATRPTSDWGPQNGGHRNNPPTYRHPRQKGYQEYAMQGMTGQGQENPAFTKY